MGMKIIKEIFRDMDIRMKISFLLCFIALCFYAAFFFTSNFKFTVIGLVFTSFQLILLLTSRIKIR